MITKRIVLTGASGYLGQHFLHSMLTTLTPPEGEAYEIHALFHNAKDFEHKVQSVDSARCSSTKRVTVHVKSLDLTNPDQVKEWKSDHLGGTNASGSSGTMANICIHTAAMSSPRACEESPDQAMDINVPKAFFRAMKGIPIVALSTDQVYDGTGVTPDRGIDGYYLDDEDVVDFDAHPPVNVYGKSKLKMERYLQEHHADNYIALRSSIILGSKAPIDPDGAHDTFLHFVQSRKEQETTYFDNEFRTVVSLASVLATLHWMVQYHLTASSSSASSSSNNIRGVYNMGGPCRVNRQDMARAVFDHFGYDPKYILPAQQMSPISPLDISMDSRKLHQLTGLGLSHGGTTMKEVVQLAFP